MQLRSGLDPQRNLDAIAQAVAEAAGAGAGYVLTPEVSIAFAENAEGLAKVAEPWEGNTAVARCADIAAGHGVILHLGSLAVALPDGRFANRSVVFGRDGAVLAQYDKIHLFDATLPGLRHYRESATYQGGDTAVVADLDTFRLGLTICYDVRFPALHRALAEAGAQVLAIPAAFTVPTGAAHWETLIRARAIETGCYAIAAAQGGVHENGRSTYGHSMIVSPWGEVLAKIEGDEIGIVYADFDAEQVAQARAKVPALDNARAFSVSVSPAAP